MKITIDKVRAEDMGGINVTTEAGVIVSESEGTDGYWYISIVRRNDGKKAYGKSLESVLEYMYCGSIMDFDNMGYEKENPEKSEFKKVYEILETLLDAFK